MTIENLKKIEIVFWITFLLVPIFTGLLGYDHHPNEYDEARHELLESHYEEGGTEGMLNIEVPDEWRDPETGEVFPNDHLIKFRENETKRLIPIWIGYGLIGFLFFAFCRFYKKARQ